MLSWSVTEKLSDKVQKTKLKDYLQEMSNKIFDIEVIEGDMVYKGTEIKARNKDHALQIMILMSGGQVTEHSDIISFEEKTIHQWQSHTEAKDLAVITNLKEHQASKKFAVLAKKGDKVKLVRFGDPKMTI